MPVSDLVRRVRGSLDWSRPKERRVAAIDGHAPRLLPVKAAGSLTLLVALGLAVALYLKVLPPLVEAYDATGQKRYELDGLELVKTTITVCGFIGAVLAGVYGYRKQRLSEGDASRADSDQFSNHYSRAAEQLGHERAAVRLAGVYAMARLADDWSDQRQVCVDVLCAYLRMPYRSPDSSIERESEQESNWRGEQEVRQTIIRVIRDHLAVAAPDGRASVRRQRAGRGAAIRSWSECNFDFTGAVFEGSSFDGANFSNGTVSFREARFVAGEASFRNATFSGATVTFDRARFTGVRVVFDHAIFSGGRVTFSSVQAENAALMFQDANFSGGTVIFDQATFSGSTVAFDRSEFSGATVTFQRVTLTQASAGLSFDESAFSAGRVSLDRAEFHVGRLSMARAEFHGGTVTFENARFAGDASFDGAGFSGAAVSFRRAKFDRDIISFHDAEFMAGVVTFDEAEFTAGTMTFDGAKSSGGSVTFDSLQSNVGSVDWGPFRAGPTEGT